MTYAGGQWQEACLFDIQFLNGTASEFSAKTKEISFEGGNKPISIETLINGGNLTNFDPADKFIISAKLVVAEIDEIDQKFLGDSADSSQPLSSTITLTRTPLRAAVLWHNGSTATSASSATGASDKAYRIVASDGYITECIPDFTDKRKTLNVKLEFPPFSPSATGLQKRESSDGTGALPALGAYTTTTS